MPVPIKTYQYDLDGNFINEYPSQIVASEQICVSQNSIRRHIWRQRQTCGGFIFTQTFHIKLPKTLLPKKGRINSKCKKIVQYDSSGNFVKEWNKPKEIMDTLNIKYKTLQRCLTGGTNICKGFKWKYKD